MFTVAYHDAMTKTELLTTVEVAHRLGVTKQHVARLVRSGRLNPELQAPGSTGAMFFAPEEVERLALERAA